MRALALAVLLPAAAWAAPRLERAVFSSTTTALPPAAAPMTGAAYWFKTYSTAPYKEAWNGELAATKFSRDLPKILAAIKANGGELTQPLATFVSSRKDQTQQLSFTFPLKNAKGLVKALRGFGDMADPTVRATGVPIPLDEVRAKIAVMMKEKTDHGAELAKVPAAAAAEDEILEHLLTVEEVGARTVAEGRFDLSVRQK